MADKRHARERIRRERALRVRAWSLGCSPELLRAFLHSRESAADQPNQSQGPIGE